MYKSQNVLEHWLAPAAAAAGFQNEAIIVKSIMRIVTMILHTSNRSLQIILTYISSSTYC